MRRASRFLRTLIQEFSDNALTVVAAQLAYWSELAVVPFLMFLLTLVGFLPVQNVAARMMGALYEVAPPEAARLIQSVTDGIVGQQHGKLLLVALAAALWTASGAMSALITALNRAYGVRETRAWWKVKLLSLLLTLSAAMLILVATVALIVGPEIVRRLWALFGFGGAFDELWKWLRWPTVTLAMMLMLANCYYFLPNVKTRRWRFITPGAVTAIVLWVAASLVFRTYVTHFNSYDRTYGALGAIAMLLTWIYLSCLTVILGGQMNAILDRQVKRLRHREKEAGPTTAPDPYVTSH